MGKEYEAKILNINIDKMRKILLASGATLVHKFTKYQRAVYKPCDPNIKGYARVRDEGNSVTMTSKIYKDEKFPEEYEITIKESFEVGVNFMKSLGLIQKAFQESYREKWSHPLAHEITFDIIPGLPIYMEIDCTSEKKLNELIKILNVDIKLKRYGAFDKTYNEYYGIPLNELNDETPFLTFDNIINEISINKNRDLLKKIATLQKKIKSIDKFIDEYSNIYDKFIKNSLDTPKPKRQTRSTKPKKSTKN